MKQLIAALLCCLLLCGCAQEAPADAASPMKETAAISTTAPMGLYEAGSRLEQKWKGAVRAYPLNLTDAYGLMAFGDGVLVLSGEETTTLTLLVGEGLYAAASVKLDFLLSAGDPSLVVCGKALSYYDPLSRETVVLDGGLKPVSRIAAPEDLTGTPVLSEDRNMLYYCTSDSLRAWDLESGIRRTVKEMAYPGQSVAGIHWGGTIVQCSVEDRNLFLSADTGQTVREWEGEIALASSDNSFCASFQLGLNPVLVFGEGSDAKILLPEEPSGQYLCFQNGVGAVRISTASEQELRLEYYDLSGGLRSSVLTLEPEYAPTDAVCSDRFVYLLTSDPDYGCGTIYRWDTQQLAANDAENRTGAYATEEAPQSAALAECRAMAQALGAKYGVEILIGEEAADVQPWDYDLEAEIQPALIERELALLEKRLERYPAGMLEATASNFTSLKLCLVRSVIGSAESGSLTAATGVQFLEGTEAYVVITAGPYAEQALYHELFHAMETHILNYSIAFDQWETLNPAGFAYDYGYAANALRDSGIYLQSEHRAFIDTYSMSFPKEDRARIMEYAMLDGNRELFKAPILQAKLKTLCEGIREAYGLESTAEVYAWEQYLEK